MRFAAGGDSVLSDATGLAGAAMAAAVELKGDRSSEEFRQLAAKAKDANQARRLLALAAIRDGKTRAEAARIGGMDRQTLRDWVHAVNARGLDGLINRKAPGRKPKLGADQKEEVRAIVPIPRWTAWCAGAASTCAASSRSASASISTRCRSAGC